MTSHHLTRSLTTLLAAGAVVGASLAVSACTVPPAIGVDWSSDTDDTSDTSDTTDTTDTTDSTTSTTSTTDPAPVDTGPAWAADGTVAVALTVHVERHDTEVHDEAEFDAHVATLEQLADLAEQYGVVLNLELSSPFVEAVDQWDSTFIEDMTARGHAVSQHSGDRSIDGLTGEARVAELTRQRDAIEAHGVDVTYVSGGCSDDAGWVEDAIAAGFDAVTGTTEFCLASLDDATLPDGMDWVRDCPNAAVCHDPLHIQLERLLHPWTTSSTSTWLVDDPAGGLVVVPGSEADGLAAMSMTGDADLESSLTQWTALLDGAVAAAVPGQVNSMNVVVSVGPTPDWEVLEAMFAAASDRVVTGDIAWVSLADVVAASVAEAPSQPADPAVVPTDTTSDLGGTMPGRPVGGTLPPVTTTV